MTKRPYELCERCGAHLSDLFVGGMGDWRNTITCKICGHTRDRVPDKVLWTLLASQYDTTPERMAQAQSEIDRYYLMVCSGKDVSHLVRMYTGCPEGGILSIASGIRSYRASSGGEFESLDGLLAEV